jgi:GT2 family glycosyltransferase
MIFSLIICTYNRSESLKRLLKSLKLQTLYPNEILIVDASINEVTRKMLQRHDFQAVKYFKVGNEDRGLTLQRNFGIDQVSHNSEFICFLDDDIVPDNQYFQKLLETYNYKPKAVATGGWIIDETKWKEAPLDYFPEFDEYLIDGYVRKLGQRNVLRKRLGLLSSLHPGVMPECSHGFSTGFLPPSDKTYEVEYFMGGVSSYRIGLFNNIRFSEKFAGYGLYEDMDFCIRTQKYGKLYVNTAAKVWHLHEESGRPNYYRYGKMVINNGFYVWRMRYPNPEMRAKLKWFCINLVLLLIRLVNGFKCKNAFDDFRGRLWALIKICFSRKPELYIHG